MNDVLDAPAITAGLATRWLGRHLEVRNQTASTNDDCAALARAGAPAGTVVVAEWQSAGRGRLGRTWTAPPGTAALLSAVLRPALPGGSLGRVGMAGALAAAEAIGRVCGVAASTKYPNDLLIAGRKVAGILVEAHLAGATVEWAVLGIGLNVRRSAVPPDLADRATSLEEHAPPPERALLIRTLLECLEPRLERAESDPDALAAEWRARDVVLGRPVSAAIGRTRLHGTAADVDRDGRLLLRLPDGKERWLLPGEVSLRG